MKKMNPLKKNPPSYNAFRGGSYSLIISAVVLALLVVTNVFASALPSAMTKYDISSTKLYSVTSNTKVVVNALEQDVTIYWIVQSGKEDDIIESLLSKYETLSGHIKVVKKNPDVFPTFTEQYTNETVQNNSLIVECGDRSRFIGYDDIYIQEADVYSYSYNTSFDGEGAITSAIDYVVSEELPQLYMLEGHGEAELPATFSVDGRFRAGGSGLCADLRTHQRYFRGRTENAGQLCDRRWKAACHGRAHIGRDAEKSVRSAGGIWRRGQRRRSN